MTHDARAGTSVRHQVCASRHRITPEVLRRVDAGEAIVVNANANKIEAVTFVNGTR